MRLLPLPILSSPVSVFLVFLVAGTASAQELRELPGDDRFLQAEMEDLYSVGAMDGEEWETFSSIPAVAFDAEGNLFILDRGNFRVVKVGSDGRRLAEMGGEGGGPGEFGAPMSMAVLPDGSTVVFDIGQRGFTLFHPDGTFNTTVPLAEGFQAIPGTGLRVHPSGDLVGPGMGLVRMSAAGVMSTEGVSGRPIHRYSLADGSSTTLFEGWKPEVAELPTPRTTSGGGTMVVYGAGSERAFEPGLHFGVLPDGSLAVVDSATYAVKVVDEAGHVRRTLVRPIPPREVTRRDREDWIAQRLEGMESGGGTRMVVAGGGGTTVSRSAQASEMMRERIESTQFADEVPVVVKLATDPGGRIWVERAGTRVGEEGPIDLLTPEGEYLGSLDRETFRIPDAFGPDGLVAFIERDELDVPRVEVKRLGIG